MQQRFGKEPGPWGDVSPDLRSSDKCHRHPNIHFKYLYQECSLFKGCRFFGVFGGPGSQGISGVSAPQSCIKFLLSDIIEQRQLGRPLPAPFCFSGRACSVRFNQIPSPKRVDRRLTRLRYQITPQGYILPKARERASILTCRSNPDCLGNASVDWAYVKGVTTMPWLDVAFGAS